MSEPPDQEPSYPPTTTRRLEWAWFTLAVLALIAVVWYAFTAKGQLNEMINQNRLAQGLAKVSADQAVAVRQSADAAVEATRAARTAMAAVEQTSTKIGEENRAWVALKDSRLELRAGRRPTVSATVSNSGKTPALNVVMRGGCGYGPVYSQERLPAPGEPLDPMVIPPQLDIVTPCLTRNPIDQATIDTIVNGTSAFVFAGNINYTDRFGGKPHSTRFCLFFDHTKNRMSFCSAPNSNYAD
jgi:hypothetical protein